MKTFVPMIVEVSVSLVLTSMLAGVVSQTGKLVAAQNKSLTMVIDEDGSTHTYEVAPSATITRNGRPVTLEDLVPGDDLRVTLDSTQSVTSCDATSAVQRFRHSRSP